VNGLDKGTAKIVAQVGDNPMKKQRAKFDLHRTNGRTAFAIRPWSFD